MYPSGCYILRVWSGGVGLLNCLCASRFRTGWCGRSSGEARAVCSRSRTSFGAGRNLSVALRGTVCRHWTGRAVRTWCHSCHESRVLALLPSQPPRVVPYYSSPCSPSGSSTTPVQAQAVPGASVTTSRCVLRIEDRPRQSCEACRGCWAGYRMRPAGHTRCGVALHARVQGGRGGGYCIACRQSLTPTEEKHQVKSQAHGAQGSEVTFGEVRAGGLVALWCG